MFISITFQLFVIYLLCVRVHAGVSVGGYLHPVQSEGGDGEGCEGDGGRENQGVPGLASDPAVSSKETGPQHGCKPYNCCLQIQMFYHNLTSFSQQESNPAAKGYFN